MPATQTILAELEQIANRAVAVAVTIHVVLALLALACAFGARPTRRQALLLVSLLLGNVTALAFAFGNPFNAAIFATLCLAHALAAVTCAGAMQRAHEARGARALGWFLIVFGWSYPHFLKHSSPFAYLIAAPLGVLPCPTLAFSLGLGLTGLVRAPAALSLLIGAAALFYGTFGLLRLGVLLDGVLIMGALAQLLLELRFRRGRARAIDVS